MVNEIIEAIASIAEVGGAVAKPESTSPILKIIGLLTWGLVIVAINILIMK